MAKAQFKMQFVNDPAFNRLAILKSVWKDARISNVEEYMVEQNPAAEQAQKLEFEDKQAGINQKNSDAKLKDAQAAEIMGQVPPKPQTEDPHRSKEMEQKDRELALREREQAERRAMDDYNADVAAAEIIHDD